MNIILEAQRMKQLTETNLGIINDLDPQLNSLLLQMGLDIAQLARENLVDNDNVDTGDLLRDINVKEVNETEKTILVGTDLFQGPIIEFGRGVVVPVKAKVLRWVDRDGNVVFSMRSEATQPMPFLEPAVIEITSKFADVFTNEMTSWLGTKIV